MHKSSFQNWAIVACLLLAACGGDVKESLGLKREAPDEFRVVARPPLSVPPDFGLRPPSSAPDIGATTASRDAQSLVLGKESASASQTLEEKQQAATADTAVGVVTTGELETPGESKFLQNAGAEKADSKIRDKIYEETYVEPQAEKGFFDKLWPDSKEKKKEPEPVVDAEAEKKRIEENEKAGKDVTEGDTPVVEKRKKRGLLGDVFGN